MSLPTGTVTFLFTDIEGSTRMAAELAGSWPTIRLRHLDILRAAVAANDGIEVGTEGDSVFAVFASAPKGVLAAIRAQRELAAEGWPAEATVRVRMGLHSGEGVLSGPDYVGIDVHRAARIEAAAHGGQVIISGTTLALTEGTLPEGVTVHDLGEHRLKDLSRPERLAMLVIDGLRADFPPPRTLDVIPNNLPTQLTSFLGRDRELGEIRGLLEDARLLTLTGPGGTGKTRLALQLAAELTEQFPDGVFFVPLATIASPELVAPTIAQVLGVVGPGGHPIEHLSGQLAGKRLLMVLDNFEQVSAAATDIAELLQKVPGIKVLVTSRSPLRVYGEREYPVAPLQLPDPDQLPDAAALSQFGAVALFVERAMAVNPAFRVDAASAPAIAEICLRLDGLPLALELAAARVRVLSPQAILARLGDRLTLLSGGARDLPERQQTLRGAIDWSHDLLGDVQRAVFARMGVFAGGADLEAAERVTLAEWPSELGGAPDALDAMAALVDQSLLRQEMTADGDTRFRMLSTIREYALERLAEGGELDELRERHADYFLSLAESAAAGLFGPDQRALLDRLEREHDNLRAAVVFCLGGERVEWALRFLAALWRFWQMRGYLPEARDRAERILALPQNDQHPRALLGALEAAGGIAYWQADHAAARVWYRRQREVAEQLGDERAMAESYYNESSAFSFDTAGAGTARELSGEALRRYRALGDRNGEGRALWGIANGYIFDEVPIEGHQVATAATGIFRQLGDRFMLGWSLYTLALIEKLRDDLPAARAALEEAIEIFRTSGDVSAYALVLDGFATIEWAAGDLDRAMRLAGAAAALQDVTGVGLAARNRELAGFFPQDLFEQAPLAKAYDAGKQLTPDEAIRLALHQDAEPA